MLKMPILIFGLLMFTSSMLIAEPLRFAQITNSPDQIVGAAVLKVVYAKAGVSIEIIPLSGKRALLESSQGRLDGEVHRILEILLQLFISNRQYFLKIRKVSLMAASHSEEK
jgi:polar amino acid transport system substrate-binding protein